MGRKSGGDLVRMLRRDVEASIAKGYVTAEGVVEHLRSMNQNYARKKVQPFTASVNQIMDAMTRSNKDDSFVRKRRLFDQQEEKLRKRRRQLSGASSGGSSTSLATSKSLDVDSDHEVLSTSGDSVYEQKSEPEFDLMKTIMRENLSQRPKKTIVLRTKKVVTDDGKSDNGTADEIRKVAGNKSNGPFFRDLGGMNTVIKQLMDGVIFPFSNPEPHRHLGLKPVSGILLHGPPGCGKTMLAHAIANETGAPFYQISASELVSGVSGASEEKIRDLFAKALKTAPSVVFIDEIDAIASKRENLHRGMECRIVTQLMICMYESSRLLKSSVGNENSDSPDSRNGHLLVIGATNYPDSIDPALRRHGRFSREVYIGLPDEKARVDILSVLLSRVKVHGAVDLQKIAHHTPGFVGADLSDLVEWAGQLAVKRVNCQRNSSAESVDLNPTDDWWKQPWLPHEFEQLFITMADFEGAVKFVQPSTRREGFSTVPDVKWDDVGGLDCLRNELDFDIVQRIKFPKKYEAFGANMADGILLYGPPGCGKTLIGMAVANESGANFIYVKGPELLNKYVGESEQAVRTLFRRARTCSPCILFLDEIDSLGASRGGEGGWAADKLLNQLLSEMDGAEKLNDVYVIGATNRPQVMDSALMRSGRLGTHLYVPLPSPEERGIILKTLARKKPIDENMDLMAFGRGSACHNFSGANLSKLMNEAVKAALRESFASAPPDAAGEVKSTIKEIHFEKALSKVSVSVTEEQIQFFKRYSESIGAA